MQGGSSNWRPVQGDASGMSMDAGAAADWQAQLHPEARGRIVNKIMDTLQKYLPIYGQVSLGELRNIARRFEEKIFTAATSQSDYLRKISLKLVTMEIKTQNSGVTNEMPSNPTSQNPPDADSMDSTGQTSQPGPDWQQETYQKLQSMRDMYYADLNEIHQRVILKCQQEGALTLLGKHSEQLENMKKVKSLMDRLLGLLKIPKSSIQPTLKEKLPYFEKQILRVIIASRRRKLIPPQLQGQRQFPHTGGNIQSMSQQPSSQAPTQQHGSHGNQMPTIVVQGSVTSMPSVAVSSMQNACMPLSTHVGVPANTEEHHESIRLIPR